ncbi:Hypothetical protein A7982_10985 [Minicystis rosea]|nr:Hypothetical protein A7982_10985 [Minicystis rosea]
MKRFSALLLGAWMMGCSAPTETGACNVSAVEGLEVADHDPYGGAFTLGYPPYAVDGCSLAYVTTSGALRLRDLAGGGEKVLAEAPEAPRRPAIAGDLVAWEAEVDGKVVVRVRDAKGTVTIAGDFDHAGEPRVAADAVVFTGFREADDDGDTDVFLFTPSTGAVTVVASGPAQQRFADVSTTHVAWTDFAEDPDGTFGADSIDVADVVVLDRGTNTATTRKLEGKQAFPMLGAAGKIAYLDWGLVHPEPKFSAYGIRLGPLGGDGSDDADVANLTTQILYVRPVTRGDRIAWVTTDGAGSSLQERRVDLESPEETVNVFPSGDVFGPSASDSMTLVGASGTNGSVTLRAFTR